MPDLGTLKPNSTVSAGGWTDESGGSTNLHGPLSGASEPDTNYIRSGTGATTACVVGLGPLPGDFSTLDTANATVRYSVGSVEGGSAGSGDDTHGLEITLLDAAGSNVSNALTIFSRIGGAAPTTVGPLSFTGLTGGAPAQARIHRTFSVNMSSDGHRVWVDFVTVGGTYTNAVVVAGSQAVETDTANAGSVISEPGDVVVAGSQAVETDTANAGSVRVSVAGSQAVETDTANAGTAVVDDGSQPDPAGIPSEVVGRLNRLAGAVEREAAGAANVWAGTQGLEVLGALRRIADSDGEMLGVLRDINRDQAVPEGDEVNAALGNLL